LIRGPGEGVEIVEGNLVFGLSLQNLSGSLILDWDDRGMMQVVNAIRRTRVSPSLNCPKEQIKELSRKIRRNCFSKIKCHKKFVLPTHTS